MHMNNLTEKSSKIFQSIFWLACQPEPHSLYLVGQLDIRNLENQNHSAPAIHLCSFDARQYIDDHTRTAFWVVF